ncbi:hypothetical protein JW935_17395 [candidate division KSB1 bacterium]|nr:hypothetical protein [candidate division KSB1 bacterium]
MKKIAIVFLCMWLPALVIAKPRFSINAGMNRSWIRNAHVETAGYWGPAFGIGLERNKQVGLMWGVDLMVVTKKTRFLNFTRPSSPYTSHPDVMVLDTKHNDTFLELPLKIGYSIPLYSTKLYASIFAGCNLAYPIRGDSDGTWYFIFLSPEEAETYKFDYYFHHEEKPAPSGSTNCFAGLSIRYKKIAIEISYVYANNKTRFAESIGMVHELDSMYFLLRYNLN